MSDNMNRSEGPASSGPSRSGDRPDRPPRRKGFFRKKVCKFCIGKAEMDYKNPETLRRFVTDRGKILPRRITGTCAKHQRALTREIKRARAIAVLPYVSQ